jgi:hypothetical protein
MDFEAFRHGFPDRLVRPRAQAVRPERGVWRERQPVVSVLQGLELHGIHDVRPDSPASFMLRWSLQVDLDHIDHVDPLLELPKELQTALLVLLGPTVPTRRAHAVMWVLNKISVIAQV